MRQSSVLAHRGIFNCEKEKNSQRALSMALVNGFGIETDIRDLGGRIVISHDPPEHSLESSLEWLLGVISSSAASSARVGLNIKSDGLATLIEARIKEIGVKVSKFFAFDMSIPDSLSYINSEIPVYSRISEYEPDPAFKNKVAGVWIDNFTGDYPQVERAKKMIDEGLRVALVSPELHGRNHRRMWQQIYDSGIYKSDLFELCTDFPLDAAKMFCNN